jgi:hypothetical protein
VAVDTDKIWEAIRRLEEADERERKAREEQYERERKAREEQYERERKTREEQYEQERKARQEQYEQLHKAIQELRQAIEQERKARMEADNALREQIQELGRRIEQVLGRIGDQIGSVWESIGAPYVMKYLETTEGLVWTEPLESRYVCVNGAEYEFDLYGVAKKDGVSFVVVGEVKRILSGPDVEAFGLKTKVLERRHRRRVIKVLFGQHAQRAAVEAARRHGMRLILHRRRTRNRVR